MTDTRRNFLGNVIGSLAMAGIGRLEQSDNRQRFVLNECSIAGFRYHDGPDILPNMHVGDQVKLVAEHGNPYDEYAVRIEHQKSRIGYLPRSQNQTVFRLLQQDAPVDCRIVEIDQQAAPWDAVKIQVSITV